MAFKGRIVTVGLSPCWDLTCRVDGIGWGDHKVTDSRTLVPAGKALNVSRALAWMGTPSVAAGLWGSDDLEKMKSELGGLKKFIDVKMTPAKGATRQNITLIDSANFREMHLRDISRLANRKTLANLKKDIESIAADDVTFVFAGALCGEQFLPAVRRIIDVCRKAGARVALDSSGGAYSEIVGFSRLWLIKPNVEELGELAGVELRDRVGDILKAGRKLLEGVEIVLVSRGARGAIAVTADGAWSARAVGKREVLSTVGCGDYFLAGFVEAYNRGADIEAALKNAVISGTAKAWMWERELRFGQVRKEIGVEIKSLS